MGVRRKNSDGSSSVRASDLDLIIFNLSTDLDDSALAFTHSWISSFANIFRSITVLSTHVGRHNLPGNVKVLEIGGGTFTLRIRGLFRLWKHSFGAFKDRKHLIVFHHMSPLTATLTGGYWRLLRVPQGLWYSHSHSSRAFKIANRLVNLLFTSVPSAIPTQSSKVRIVGHGIDVQSFALKVDMNLIRQGICSVGRITPIKNLDQAINAVSSLSNTMSTTLGPVLFVGPIRGQRDSNYQIELLQLAKVHGVKIIFIGDVVHEQLPNLLSNYLIQFNATPRSVDKSVLEGAAAGCFVVSDNQTTLHESGMTHVFGKAIEGLSLSEQIEQILNFHPMLLAYYRQNISQYVIKHHDVRNTMQRIASELISLR